MKLKYRQANGGATSVDKKFRLLKVRDEDRSACIAAAGTNYSNDANNSILKTNGVDMADSQYGAVEDAPIEILPDNGMLALYDLQAPSPALNGAINNMFYSVSFILGTIQGGINVNANNNNCVPPEDYTSSTAEAFDYCAINKFNFAAQANGG